MPFAFYRMGLFLAIITCFFIGILSHFANVMYLKVKDLTPRKLESVYEIAYLLFGRLSIFVVCFIMFMTNFALIIM